MILQVVPVSPKVPAIHGVSQAREHSKSVKKHNPMLNVFIFFSTCEQRSKPSYIWELLNTDWFMESISSPIYSRQPGSTGHCWCQKKTQATYKLSIYVANAAYYIAFLQLTPAVFSDLFGCCQLAWNGIHEISTLMSFAPSFHDENLASFSGLHRCQNGSMHLGGLHGKHELNVAQRTIYPGSPKPILCPMVVRNLLHGSSKKPFFVWSWTSGVYTWWIYLSHWL